MTTFLKTICPLWAAAMLSATPARALVFNITYDVSVTSATNSVEIQSAFGTATQYLQTLYTNNSTINLRVYWGPYGPFTNGLDLGAANTLVVGITNYAGISNALFRARTTVWDTNAVASLPSAAPVAGNVWWVPRAEAKALGFLLASNDPALDGSIGFGTNFSYAFDPANRAVAGKYDFIGVALHEITEVMGRTYFDIPTTHYLPYDLFRFTNGTRIFDKSTTAAAYFSVDNGATALRYFWTNYTAGDATDWLPAGQLDCCDYIIYRDRKEFLNHADLVALDILGYHLNYQPPVLKAAKQGGDLVFSFTNTPGTTFSLLATTNLSLAVSNWPALTVITDTVPGVFQLAGPLNLTNKFRFFRARLN